MEIAICIITYRRPDRLASLLKALGRLTFAGEMLFLTAMAAAVPRAWPMTPQVPMTRVELMAECVQLALRPANIKFEMFRDTREP